MKRWCLPLLLLAAGCGGRPTVAEPAASVETAEYRSRGEAVRGRLHRPAGRGPFPALLLLHGDRGLTGWEKEQAARLCGRGYVVLAADLYRGAVAADVLDAHIMDRGLPEDRVQADLKAAADYLAGRTDVRGDGLGVIGWDTGGGYALDAALRDPRLRAVVVCYGRLTTDPALLEPLRGSVLGVFAGKDRGIAPETLAQFRSAMDRAGKRLAGLHLYPECGHGFMNPSDPHGSGDAAAAAATAEAWEKIDTYLDAELKR